VLAQINGKRRRKKFRCLGATAGSDGRLPPYHAAMTIESLRLLDAFLEQKPARLTAQGLPNVFADPGIRAFLRPLA
jgi:CelD/BcsL family acetyltransferase involved in cellulose biosynthesis